MTITLSTISTGGNLHGTVQPAPWENAHVRQAFAGLNGEAILWLGRRGTDLQAWMQFTGYATHNALQTAITALQNQIGTYGNLVYTDADGSTQFDGCTFLGFESSEDEGPWLDGGGVNGWQCRGTLRFRWSG